MYEHHPFFICTDEDRKFIRGELGLKESTIQEGVDALMEWFEKQPHLVEAGIVCFEFPIFRHCCKHHDHGVTGGVRVDEDLDLRDHGASNLPKHRKLKTNEIHDRITIENMLVIAKGSLEKTKRRIDNFYKYRSYAPELIQNREKLLSDPEDLWSSYVQISMPRLYKGNRIAVIKLIDKEPSKFSSEILFRNTFMLGDLRLRYDYFLSDIWVIDMKNGSFSHLLKMNPLTMQKTAQIFHEGLGVRILAIHILSATALLQQVVSFMKQFFSPKIMERIIIHDSLEDLHKHLPKMYLPKDYGGDEPYLREFKDKYEKEMRSTRTKKYLTEASKMVSNESKRPNAEKNEEYLVGSFRKLDFD